MVHEHGKEALKELLFWEEEFDSHRETIRLITSPDLMVILGFIYIHL